jgi:hypothetical protein
MNAATAFGRFLFARPDAASFPNGKQQDVEIMKAKIQTVINVPAEKMWNELQMVSSLRHVAAPLLGFSACNDRPLPERWAIGEAYHLRISLFGLIPLGRHTIVIDAIRPDARAIVSKEHGRLARVWNHMIRIDPIDERRILYTDEIEIQAGILTVFVWLFAHVFYRHRQRRWKRLLG